MKTKKLLIELIELMESFEATVPNADEMGLDAFLSYALSLRATEQTLHINQTPRLDEATIAQMISILYRVARGYTKKALHDSCLQSEEEYTYLVSLLHGGQMSKTELHMRNALERTTGNEMIRRLQRSGLIHETEDPNDKRQKLVQITPKGRAELMSVFPILRQVAVLISGTLDDWQKLYLRSLLSQMADHHLGMMKELRDAPLSSYLSSLKTKD